MCDTLLPENLGVVHFNYETSQISLQFNDDTELTLNIPVDRVLSQFLVTRSDIHVGVIQNGEITAVKNPFMIVLGNPYPATQRDRFKNSVPSLKGFKTFLESAVTAQPIHRDDIKSETLLGGIMQGINPSVLKFAQQLQLQRSRELAQEYTAAPVVQAPTFGLGGSGTGANPPKTPPKKQPESPPEKENPMKFFQGLKPKQPQNPEDIDLEEILKPLDDLIGLGPVKRELRDFAYLAQSRILRRNMGLSASPVSMHMVFSGPPGTGKTTVARVLGNILKELGYLRSGHVIETDRSGMIAEWIGQTAVKTQGVIKEASGGILFIDEAYTLTPEDQFGNDFGHEAIATLLKEMEDHRDDFIVIAAGYTSEMSRFLESNPGLKSRFAMRIEFPSYSAEEMITIFRKMCADNNYTIGEDAIEKLRAHLGEMRNSTQINAFGNARGIRNIFERTMINQANRIITSKIKDQEGILHLSADDLLKNEKRLQAIPNDELQDLLRPLSSMVGMENVKKEISDLVHLLHARIIRQQQNLPTMPVVLHSIFSGPPGTGKTSVARLLGKILKRLGYLESGHVVEVDKSRLIGKYTGWTTDLVKKVINEAENGILFIDEAYALAGGSDQSDYGQEALTTILKEMEDRRDKLVVICAGYEKEMKEFIAANSGLQSRFPHRIKFKTYTHDQLIEIFMLICAEQKYNATAEAVEKLRAYLASLDAETIDAMGNARLMRNIFEKTIISQSRRIGQASDTDISSITADDIQFPDQGDVKKIGFI